MDKSFVTLEQKVCLVCGERHETGELIVDPRLRKKFDMYTVTGLGLCPKDQALFNEGYIALVEIDPERSTFRPDNGRINPEDAHLTGNYVHVRKHVYQDLFDVPVKDNQAYVYIDHEVFGLVKNIHDKCIES